MNATAERAWSEAEKTRLKQYAADESLSYAAIGRLMSRSKNSVVAALARMGEANRGNPVPPPNPNAVVLTAAERERREAGLSFEGLAAFHPIARAVLGVRGVAERPPLVSPSATCCWPMGEPRTAGFRFCEAVSVAGRSYCAEHCGKAYVVRKERSAAQAQADQVFALRVRAAKAAGRGKFSAGPLVGMA